MERFPSYIEVSSTLEFTRLVCALERTPRVSFLHEFNGKKVLSVQMDMMKESPVIYYAQVDNFDHFLSEIRVKVRKGGRSKKKGRRENRRKL